MNDPIIMGMSNGFQQLLHDALDLEMKGGGSSGFNPISKTASGSPYL